MGRCHDVGGNSAERLGEARQERWNGLVSRQNMEISRCGAGSANGTNATPSGFDTGACTASAGSSVTATPAATIWRRVSRLVARKPFVLVRTDDVTHAQRLVSKAMPLVEQEDVFIGERRDRHRFAAAARGWSLGVASTKSSVEQQIAVQSVVVDRRRDDRRRRAGRRAVVEQHLALLLDEQELQVGQLAGAPTG